MATPPPPPERPQVQVVTTGSGGSPWGHLAAGVALAFGVLALLAALGHPLGLFQPPAALAPLDPDLHNATAELAAAARDLRATAADLRAAGDRLEGLARDAQVSVASLRDAAGGIAGTTGGVRDASVRLERAVLDLRIAVEDLREARADAPGAAPGANHTSHADADAAARAAEALREQVALLSGSLDRSQAQNAELARQLRDLGGQLTNQSEGVTGLRQELTAVRAENHELKRSLAGDDRPAQTPGPEAALVVAALAAAAAAAAAASGARRGGGKP